VAVLNADDALVVAMAAHTPARVVTVGKSAGADVRAADVRLDERGRPGYRLVTPAGEAEIRLRLYGAHQVANSLAAAAVAIELGLPVPELSVALAEARQLSRWRMEVTERPDGVLVVNDAYNANPESMRAALNALMTMARGRRSWAVLGQMGELGAAAAAEHEALGRVVATLGVDRVVVVGPDAGGIGAGARREPFWKGESVHVPDVRAAVELLRREVRPGDVVLVKASRAAGLERVAQDLSGVAAAGGSGGR
jgi:UDP-N-acetylmuramoyl-tripeptide--D-alanyl-D-alanine ligase